MDNKHYILKNRKPVVADLLEWGRFLESPERIIKQETLPNGKRVSTVFLGLDHNWGKGAPLLFETMVFSEKSGGAEDDMERYSTWEEAEAGHKKMVEKYAKVAIINQK